MRKLLLSLIILISITKGTLYAQNCSINAGLNTTICLGDTIKLYGTRSGLLSANVFSRWTQISGPDAIILNPDLLITSAISHIAGTYTFKLNNKCQDGIISEDSVTIIILPITISSAGKDTVLCPQDNYILEGNKPSVNERGIWTITTNGVGVTINSPTNPNSLLTLSPSFPGITKLRWTITNSNGCSTYDDVIITNRGGVAPVNAGPDQVLDNCYAITACARLVATNGGTGFGNQIGVWSFVSGPTMPNIFNPNSPAINVCNLSIGTYIFRYTVSGPCANGFDDVAITVPPSSQNVPQVSAGTNINICDGDSSIILTGNNPSFSSEIVHWTQTSGPAIVTIHTPDNPSTLVTGLTKPGFYSFKYAITNSNSGCGGNSEIRITKFQTGTVDGGPDQVLPCDVTETTIPTTTTGLGYLNYRILNGPPGYFSYPTAYRDQNIIKGMIYPGTYRVEINYEFSAGCNSVNDFVDITVSRTPTGSNAGSYQNFACASNMTQLAGNNPALTGLGSGKWSQVSGPNAAVLANPDNYICNVRNAVSGIYTFRWTISGGNSCPDKHKDIAVIMPDSSLTIADAGADKTVCVNSPIVLTGNRFRVDETAKWSVYPKDSVIFFPSNSISSPTVSGLKANKAYTFTYVIMNSCGRLSFDTVRITTNSFSGPSAADAGLNQCLSSGTTSAQLNAAIPTSGNGIWTQIEGVPSTIVNPALHNTTITNLTNGNSKFVWTVSANRCSNITTDTAMITVSGTTTIANAGPDITRCDNQFTLRANTPEFGIGHWTQTSGDGNAVIDSADNPVTSIKNLTTGLYTFRWTITNGACPENNDETILNISKPPSVSIAGPDQTLCNLTGTVLNAVNPVSGNGQWVWVSGPSIYPYPLITNSTSPNATISNLRNGTNVFRWVVSGGPGCPQTADDIAINVSSVANAGADQSLCNLTSTSLKGNAGSSGIWSQISGPVATIIQTPINNPDANVSGLLPGSSYTFRYTIPSLSGCPSTYDDVIVNNGSPTLIPNAGVDDTYCNATSFKLNGSLPGPGERGTWSVLSGPSGALFLPDANTARAILSGVTAGVYILKWTISNGSCSNADVKRVDNYGTATTANAGADEVICIANNDEISLNANIPANGIGKWTQLSGPGNVVFDAPNNPNSNVSNLIPGTYHFLWTISNHSCSESSDEVNIIILKNTDNAFAGNDQNICANSATLKANIPTESNKGIWTQLSGPNTATLSSFINSVTELTNLIPGTYTFVWKIYNQICFNTDTVNIVVNPAVIVNAGKDFSLCSKISGITLSDAFVNGFTNIGTWSIISGKGKLSSVLPTNMPSSIIFYPADDYSGPVILRLSANDNCHTVTDEITIFVTASEVLTDAQNDSTRTDPGAAINIEVLKNDKILSGDTLKLCNNSIEIKPAHGTAMVNGDGTVSYKPVTGYIGIDSFNYKLCNLKNIKNMDNPACYLEGNDNAWVYITIEGCTIPNSFSPDGDGVNDYFEIPCAQGTIQLNVFNRWGIEVYKNEDYKNEWNGTYNNAPLPDGTYFYMLKYSTDNINKLNKDGFITIRR